MIYLYMVRVKIKGTTCCLYNIYTVVTTSHGIAAWLLVTYQEVWTENGHLPNWELEEALMLACVKCVGMAGCDIPAPR